MQTNIKHVPTNYLCTFAGCSTGDLRLAGSGTSSMQGRVELCNNNQWGTVCDDSWGTPDATVVCVQLGYSRTGKESYSAYNTKLLTALQTRVL